MNKILLIPPALALSLLAGPALAQNFYGVHHYKRHEFTITGAQMTDWPSGRFNLTQTASGDFLRPGHFIDHPSIDRPSRAVYRHSQNNDNRDEYGQGSSGNMDRDR